MGVDTMQCQAHRFVTQDKRNDHDNGNYNRNDTDSDKDRKVKGEEGGKRTYQVEAWKLGPRTFCGNKGPIRMKTKSTNKNEGIRHNDKSAHEKLESEI